MIKKKRRKFSTEFKEEAVNLITTQGYTISEAARNLGIHATQLSRWKREFEEPRNVVGPLNMTAMQAELKLLQKENKRLRMEREILKKATAFFAKDQG